MLYWPASPKSWWARSQSNNWSSIRPAPSPVCGVNPSTMGGRGSMQPHNPCSASKRPRASAICTSCWLDATADRLPATFSHTTSAGRNVSIASHWWDHNPERVPCFMPARKPARDMDWQGLPPHTTSTGGMPRQSAWVMSPRWAAATHHVHWGHAPPVGVGDVPQIGGVPVGGEDRGGPRFDVAHGDRARGPQRLCDAHVQPAVPGEQAQQRGGRWVCVFLVGIHAIRRCVTTPHPTPTKTMPTKKHRGGGEK